MHTLDRYEHLRNDLYQEVRILLDKRLLAAKTIWLVRERIEQTLGIVTAHIPSAKELGNTNQSQVLLSRLFTYVNESIDIARRNESEAFMQTRTEREAVPV